LSTHQQKRSLHYASLRSAPVGMTVFVCICDSPGLTGEGREGESNREDL
jgi:hypothetical protein